MGPFPSLFLLIRLLFLLLWEDVVNPGQVMLGEDKVQQPSDNEEAQDLWQEFRENGRLKAPSLGTLFSPSVSYVQGLFLVSVFGAISKLPQTIIHLLLSLVPLWLPSVE